MTGLLPSPARWRCSSRREEWRRIARRSGRASPATRGKRDRAAIGWRSRVYLGGYVRRPGGSMSTLVKRLVQFGPVVIVALFVVGGIKPASADDLYSVEEAACAQDLKDCYYRAAGKDSIGDRWITGIDCELTF